MRKGTLAWPPQKKANISKTCKSVHCDQDIHDIYNYHIKARVQFASRGIIWMVFQKKGIASFSEHTKRNLEVSSHRCFCLWDVRVITFASRSQDQNQLQMLFTVCHPNINFKSQEKQIIPGSFFTCSRRTTWRQHKRSAASWYSGHTMYYVQRFVAWRDQT